jgi:hypothetical protein
MNFFHWDGTPLLGADVLATTACGHAVELESGELLERPGRDDYEQVLRDLGWLGEAEVLTNRPDLVAAAQAHWHSQRGNSCIFSAYLSLERVDHGWETIVVLEAGPAKDLADGLEEVVAPRLAAPATEIVSVVLPNLDDPSELASLVGHLGDLPDWTAVEIGDEVDEQEGALVKVGLRRGVELDYQSEVLGFGCHQGAARTRLAPFTELAVRAKPPPRPKSHGRAVMADIRLPVSGSTMGEWGTETAKLRREMLGEGHDQRGKAKVTFVLPKTAWQDWKSS